MPSPVAEILAALSSAFGHLGVRWYLFGAQAAIVHGAARLTADVDVTVELAERATRELVDALARSGFALRVADVDEFVERTRVLPIVHQASQMPVDVVLAGPGIEEIFLDRAQPTDVAGVRVPVARAEDIVVMKILAGRPKDDEDVAAILSARGESMDHGEIESTLRLLEQALDQSDLIPKLRSFAAGRPPRDG